MRRSLMAFCLLFSFTGAFANTKAQQADTFYQQRDYTAEGIDNVEQAVELYAEAVALETDEKVKMAIQNQLASAWYFLGSALDNKKEQKKAHETAMEISEEIMTELGVDVKTAHELTQTEINNLINQLDDEEEVILTEAMYSKGISLAQWGSLNGIASSIGRLPEVLGLMDRIEMMGYESIHEYGPYRTIGRINYKLPGIFGGDIEKSAKYLIQATQKTLAEGQRYSINGYNNLYLAETLYKQGKENQAKRLLENFINADFDTLAEGSEPENKEALKIAEERLNDWK